ncbi:MULTISPECIES: RNA 2'-phosphotransferase [unclassified Polaromonas]|uniref:RNA 2'-phosphotransferase n=1 Tax=unclassified Polaromonas TaxID=2638319 RepID=UPI000F07B7AF|nr:MULTISPECIES: RNA 2'-phosphotransferase [unclassified Polaromonas]AYQ29143.1 RNA 2'-phosphotransferase [Polaromonas sp. SP1]QGJ19741.1 RNA 2'-phosphotransferase [Polaromonas sp. Pch-P]
MTPQHLTSTSKFLSLVLRHKPSTIGLSLDAAGWANVEELLARAASANQPLSRALLEKVVETSDKKRFSFSEDGLYIRANQGHSVDIELGLQPLTPPARLYHGTASRSLDAILAEGLTKRQRHHVHLSESSETATAVGRRYGQPVLLAVDTQRMAAEGYLFFRSENNVWLTDHVPAVYLSIIDAGSLE